MSGNNKGISSVKSMMTPDPINDMQVVMPSAIPDSVARAFNSSLPRLQMRKKEEDQNRQVSWYLLESISNEIRNHVGNTVMKISESVELVRLAQTLPDMASFNLNATALEQDMKKFTNDLIAIQKRHEGRHGFITESEDYAVFMSVKEDYTAFLALFDSVFMDKIIDFTSYALEARDIIMKKVEEEEAAAAQIQPEIAP